MPVPGTHNLRDLGGYRGYAGHRVRCHLLYRSDQLSQLTDEGLAQMQALGIKTIIDLRSEREIEKSPNRDIGAAQTVVCNPSAETAELAASFQANAKDEDRLLVESLSQKMPEDPYEGILVQYRRFANTDASIEAFARAMQLVANPENAPLIFHCRGGKDRTGFLAMLILGALGVSEEDIVADYLVTRSNRAARTDEKMHKYEQYTDNRRVLDYLRALLDTAPAYIASSLREIERISGSLEGYLLGPLGLREEQLRAMRRAYLEE